MAAAFPCSWTYASAVSSIRRRAFGVSPSNGASRRPASRSTSSRTLQGHNFVSSYRLRVSRRQLRFAHSGSDGARELKTVFVVGVRAWFSSARRWSASVALPRRRRPGVSYLRGGLLLGPAKRASGRHRTRRLVVVLSASEVGAGSDARFSRGSMRRPNRDVSPLLTTRPEFGKRERLSRCQRGRRRYEPRSRRGKVMDVSCSIVGLAVAA